jgi:hypothetical protein
VDEHGRDASRDLFMIALQHVRQFHVLASLTGSISRME